MTDSAKTVGWSHVAAKYLREHGFVSVVPAIRSSDYELSLANPFHYYLSRRLGLVDPSYLDVPMERGTAFHIAAELDISDNLNASEASGTPDGKNRLMLPYDEDAKAKHASRFGQIMEARADEFRRSLIRRGESTEKAEALSSRMRTIWSEALILYQAFATTPLHFMPTHTGRRYLFADTRILAAEQTISIPASVAFSSSRHLLPVLPNMPLVRELKDIHLVARPDLIVYQTQKRRLCIIDWKTTSLPLSTRASTIPLEFQPEHYIWVTQQWLRTDEGRSLLEKHDVPQDTPIAGIIHALVRVPQLSFGSMDRPYTETQKEITRGPNKGEVRTVRNYHGDPDPKIYLRRIKDKILARGLYAHEAPSRTNDPWIDFAYSRTSTLHIERYRTRLQHLISMAARPAYPISFLSSSRVAGPSGISWPGLFASCDPAEWPFLIRKLGLIVSHRDTPNHHQNTTKNS